MHSTGSWVCLRRMCFAMVKVAGRIRYPTKSSWNFSDRKYSFLTVDSLQRMSELPNPKRVLNLSWDDDIATDEFCNDEHCMEELSLARCVTPCVVGVGIWHLHIEQRQTVTHVEMRHESSLHKLSLAWLTVWKRNSQVRVDKPPNMCFRRHVISGFIDNALPLAYLDRYEGYISCGYPRRHNSGTDIMWAATKLSISNTFISFGRPQQSVINNWWAVMPFKSIGNGSMRAAICRGVCFVACDENSCLWWGALIRVCEWYVEPISSWEKLLRKLFTCIMCRHLLRFCCSAWCDSYEGIKTHSLFIIVQNDYRLWGVHDFQRIS